LFTGTKIRKIIDIEQLRTKKDIDNRQFKSSQSALEFSDSLSQKKYSKKTKKMEEF